MVYFSSGEPTNFELLQQLGAINNLEFAPRLRRQLLQMLPENEIDFPVQHVDEDHRLRELELELELEREKNKPKTFSAIASLQGC